jgi:hypothetical protein
MSGLLAELKRRNERLHSLSLIGTIDGGEGWGEGAACPISARPTSIERIPLTQPSPPSTLGGEGLKHCVDGIGTVAAGRRMTP